MTVLGMLAVLSACAANQQTQGESGRYNYDRSSKEQRISSLETALADALIELEKVKARDTVAPTVDVDLPAMPPNAVDGQCYARMLVPPQYVTRSERRIVKEATESFETVPARTEWVEERVVVSEAYTKLKVVPATYKWVTERTLVRPETSRQVMVAPARFETVTERVLEKPAEKVWRPGRGAVEKIDEETGRIMHLAEVPAQYRTIQKKVLAEAPQYRRVIDPAVYETVRKKVVDQPERTVKVEVPAEYKTVRVQQVVTPEKVVRHQIPAVYEKFSYREKVEEEKLDWRRIACPDDKNEIVVRQLQKALHREGYDPGYADGVIGKKTLAAVNAYQVDKGLATGRLSVETFESLGVNIDERVKTASRP